MGLSNKSNLLWYYSSDDISSAEKAAFNNWTSKLNQSKHERFTFDQGQPDGKVYYISHNDTDIKIQDNGWLNFNKDPGDRSHVQLEIASDGNESWSKSHLNGRVLADKYFEFGFKAKVAPETLKDLAWVNVFQSTQVTGATTNPPIGINIVKTGGTKYDGEARWVLKAYGDKGNGASPDKVYQKIGPAKVVADKIYDHVVKFEFADNGKIEWYLDGKLQYKASGLLGYDAENIKPKIGVYGAGDKAISFNDAYLKYADGSSGGSTPSKPSSGGSSSVIDKDTGSLDSVAKGGSSLKAGTYKLSSLDGQGYISSGSNLLKTHGKGNFKFIWDGPDKKVGMTLKYQEESDGNPTAQVRVDGKVMDSWKYDKGSDLETHVTKLDLDHGDVVEIHGQANAGAYARFADWIHIA